MSDYREGVNRPGGSERRKAGTTPPEGSAVADADYRRIKKVSGEHFDQFQKESTLDKLILINCSYVNPAYVAFYLRAREDGMTAEQARRYALEREAKIVLVYLPPEVQLAIQTALTGGDLKAVENYVVGSIRRDPEVRAALDAAAQVEKATA